MCHEFIICVNPVQQEVKSQVGQVVKVKVDGQGEEGRGDLWWGLIREETWNKHHLSRSDEWKVP